MQRLVDHTLAVTKESVKTLTYESLNNVVRLINGVSALLLTILPGKSAILEGIHGWELRPTFRGPRFPQWMENGASSFNQFIHELSIDSDTSSSSVDYSSSEEEYTDETICPPSPLSQSSRVSRTRSISRRNRHWMHWFRYIISWLLLPIKLMLRLPLFIYALGRGSRTSRASGSFQSSHVQARKRLQTLRDQVIQCATDRRRGVVEDATIEHLLPIILSLLKDDFSEVRLKIVSKLDQVDKVIGIGLLSQSLLLIIVELTDVKHSWRLRHAIIELIPMLASQLGVGIYNDELGGLCMQWLKDKVCAIREAAGKNLKRLTELFGREWASEHIIPQVLNMVNDNYHCRMNMLHVLLNLAPVMGSEIACSQFLPVILAASKDRVPNVRFNVVKVLKSLASVVDQSVMEKSIRPCLNELKEDKDADVEYFAKQALQAIDEVIGQN